MRRFLLFIGTALALGLAGAVPSHAGSHATALAASSFVPRFEVQNPGGQIHPDARTVPTWSGSFTYGGASYPYSTVGTDPSAGSATTTVPVEIIPLRMVFSDGSIYDGSTKVAATTASPIFQNANFSTGTTQYGDAMQRANFWSTVSSTSPSWHVLLGGPTVLATETLDVPSGQGYESPAPGNGQTIGLVADKWFANQLLNLTNSLHIDPTTLPIFLTYNTFTYTPTLCCTLGFHGWTSSNGNGNQPVQTYIFAAYMDPGLVQPPFDNIQDVSILSHEVAEWMNDPFGQNVVPSWTTALTQFYYGCSTLLEVGDPLVGVDFTVQSGGATYHPQDVAFLPWFERTPASTSLNGQYTYLGTYTTYSPSC